MTTSTNTHRFLILLIVLLAPVGQMAIDIYVTALPSMAQEFRVSNNEVQLSVSAYLLAFAIGQLVYGPVADAVGRKRALLWGIAIYLAGSVLALVPGDLPLFVVARVLQGLGITAASVVMKAIATDHFKGSQLANVMTYMVVGWGMGPIVAPVIGAQLQNWFGWRACLYFLLGYGMLLLVLVRYGYRESLQQPVPLKASVLLGNTIAILRHTQFQLCFLTMGACYGILLTFNICAPFMVQDVLHRDPAYFSTVALAMGAMYFLGVFSNRFNASRIATSVLCRRAALAILGAALIMLGLALGVGLTVWTLLAPSLAMTFFAGVIYPNLMARGVSLFPQFVGLSSSVLGFALMTCAALIMALSSILRLDSLVPLASLYTAIAALCAIMLHALYPRTAPARPDSVTTQ